MSAPKLSISAVDLFCGAGGLSLGLQTSGIQIAAGFDLDPQCRFPFEHNLKASFHQRDVSELSGQELAKFFKPGAVRVLAACAPCQPFSGYASKYIRKKSDQSWRLVFEVVRLASEARPEILTIENVSRLSRLPIWRQVVRQLNDLGYSTTWAVLNAAHFGVPQARKRLVLLASLYGTISLPKPTHEKKPNSVRQAIGKLEATEAGVTNAKDAMHMTC